MKPTKSILIGLATTASIMGGVDASVLNEQPISRVEMVANERVEAKQIGNVIETTLPWKDQAGLKVKVDLGEPTLAERFADERKKEVITETVTDFEGGFKVDILLNEKPTTNVFCYDIEGDENYDFFYQPPLTAEEIANGDNRPPEIEGSYAVYHKTLKNHQIGKENYATGKVMHIPRPQVWSLSDVETKVWADMTYSEKDGLCVTVPQEFLDTANYPIRVDPTFGYTTAGASFSAVNANAWRGSVFTSPTERGTIQSISVSSERGAGTPEAKVVIVLNSSLSIVSNGVGGDISPSCTNVGKAWRTGTFSTPPSFSASTDYVLSIVSSVTSCAVYYDTGSTNQGASETDNNYTTPTDPTAISQDTRMHSIYATYTSVPAVTTNSATSISSSTATLNGNISSDGGASTTQHGFAWGTDATLSGGDTATTTLGATSTGAIYQTLTSLSPNTTYYFRAYAVNSVGTSTGSILNFKTTYVPSTLKYIQMDGGLNVKGGVIIK